VSSEHPIGQVSDFPDGSSRIYVIDGSEVGVYRQGEDFYAYENTCAHAGGPVCEGFVLGKVEPVLEPDKTIEGERFSSDELHIVCPWHGYEFALKTGKCVSDRRLRLKRYSVTRSGDELYVVL
jgi:nitrite reductase/ring-hydroxylating ferredoxin subunit